MPSSQPQTPFAGVDSDQDQVRERSRVGEQLALRGVFGLVWLDGDLVVRRCFGTVVDFVETGAPVAKSVPACIGLEDDIKALTNDLASAVRIPNATIVTAASAVPRLNFVFYRLDQHIVMVVWPAGTGGSLEIELSRQTRGRHIAEAELAAKSQELLRANADLRIANTKLEQFAAIATHDLKAPMRALRYMCEDISAAISRGDGVTARTKLDELQRQSARLSTMLSGLLRYSSAGPDEVEIERVDTHALVEVIVSSLPTAGASVTLSGNWPVLDTFAVPLDLALRNLIDNAIRHHDRGEGHIVVACEDQPRALQISVADDGPGIPLERQPRIFLPFSSPSTDGEGIGLAIVQKMVGAVGGTVTVHSDPSQRRGTTFVVQWPKICA